MIHSYDGFGRANIVTNGIIIPGVRFDVQNEVTPSKTSVRVSGGVRNKRRQQTTQATQARIPRINSAGLYKDQAGTVPAFCYKVGRYFIILGENLDMEGLSFYVKHNGVDTSLSSIDSAFSYNTVLTELIDGDDSGAVSIYVDYTISKADYNNLPVDLQDELDNDANSKVDSGTSYTYNLRVVGVASDRTVWGLTNVLYAVSDIYYDNGGYVPDGDSLRSMSAYAELVTTAESGEVNGQFSFVSNVINPPFYSNNNVIQRRALRSGNSSSTLARFTRGAEGVEWSFTSPPMSLTFDKAPEDTSYTLTIVEAGGTAVNWFNPSGGGEVSFAVFLSVGTPNASNTGLVFTEEVRVFRIPVTANAPFSLPSQVITSFTPTRFETIIQCVD